MRAGFVNVLDLNVMETSRKSCRDVVAAKARLTSLRDLRVDVSRKESRESRVRSMDQNLVKDWDIFFYWYPGRYVVRWLGFEGRAISRIGRWDSNVK